MLLSQRLQPGDEFGPVNGAIKVHHQLYTFLEAHGGDGGDASLGELSFVHQEWLLLQAPGMRRYGAYGGAKFITIDDAIM